MSNIENLYAFKVKKATVEDASEILRVTHEAFVLYAEWSGLTNIDALKETLADVINDIENKIVFIVEIDKKVVGAVRLKISDDDGKTAYLSRFAIDEKHRNSGIGKILMNVVDKYLINEGVSKVTLHTNSKVTPLARFYYGRGFYISSVNYERGYPRAEFVKEYK